MDDYLNKTSLGFIFAFITIIACTIGLMEVLSRIENGEEGTATQRAESAEIETTPAHE